MKRDEQGRTKLERIRDEAYQERKRLVLTTIAVTTLFAFPLGVIVGWLTAI